MKLTVLLYLTVPLVHLDTHILESLHHHRHHHHHPVYLHQLEQSKTIENAIF